MLLKDWLYNLGIFHFSPLASQPWRLHFENDDGDDGDGEDGDGEDGDDDAAAKKKKEMDSQNNDAKNGKFMTQDQIDRVIEKRLRKERSESRKTLTRLQELEQTLKMSDDERTQLQAEIDSLEKRTMTADEIRKREEKKATEKYQQELKAAQDNAETWQERYTDLKIDYEIGTASQQNGVLPNSLPMVTAFLRPRTKLVDEVADDGTKTGRHVSQVDFEDRDSEGKPIAVQMTIGEVITRMRELPDNYGNLFDSDRSGGLGSNNGKPAGSRKDGYRSGMSMAEYMKLRKENPDAVYGESGV